MNRNTIMTFLIKLRVSFVFARIDELAIPKESEGLPKLTEEVWDRLVSSKTGISATEKICKKKREMEKITTEMPKIPATFPFGISPDKSINPSQKTKLANMENPDKSERRIMNISIRLKLRENAR